MALSLLTPWQSSAPLDPAKARARLRGGAYTDAQVDQFLAALFHHAETTGMATAALAGQVAKETANFRYGGQVKPEQFNFAGIAATNDGAAGHSFGSINGGVMGLIAHHGNYLWGAFADWPPAWDDYKTATVRHMEVLASGHAGKVRTIGDYTNGRWAWTPTVPLGSLQNGYARGIVEIGNTLLGGGTVAYSKRQQLVKAGMDNRPGNPLNGNGVATAYTIHNTDNPKAGANAAMHANYVGNGGGPDSSSYHDVADDHEVVNLIPYNEAAFHIGDWSTGPGWISSYGIEICENAGIDFPQACRNAARAVAERMIADGHAGEYGRVKKHGDWWTPQHPQVHKGCPARLLAGWQGVTWEVFLGMVKAATEQLGGATKVPVSPSGDPGFPGCLQPDGSSRLNGVPFGGTLVRVEWVELGGVNAAGERYSRKWQGHKLEEWVKR